MVPLSSCVVLGWPVHSLCEVMVFIVGKVRHLSIQVLQSSNGTGLLAFGHTIHFNGMFPSFWAICWLGNLFGNLSNQPA